jgi:hypothetical protein
LILPDKFSNLPNFDVHNTLFHLFLKNSIIIPIKMVI